MDYHMVLEVSIEEYLDKRARALGGFTVKLQPEGNRGIPDRLVVLPGGVVLFVELKRPKKGVLAKLQKVWHKVLTSMGHRAYIASTKEAVDEILHPYT